MGPANMKRYRLFLRESTEWFPQKYNSDLLKKQHGIVGIVCGSKISFQLATAPVYFEFLRHIII